MPLSLHDLIYGDDETKCPKQEETKAAEPSQKEHFSGAADGSSSLRPNRKRPPPPSADTASRQKGKKKTSRNNDTTAADATADTAENVFATTSQRLDVLYSAASLSTSAASTTSHQQQSSIENNNIATDSTQSLLQPPVVASSARKLKSKIHYAKPGRPHTKNTHLTVLASAEQIQQRKLQQKRQQEWSRIRQNWKSRKYDLRTEVDVGNAVKRTMQQVQQHQATTRKRPPSDRTAAQQPAQKEQDEYPDTSDEEQENILSQLMEGSQQAKAAKALSSQENQTAPDTRPYAERLNYWERGLSQPDSNEIDNYQKRIVTLMQELPESRQHKKKVAPQTGDTITLKECKLPRRTTVDDSYFPLDRNIYCNPNFAHCRQLLRLAARYVITSSAGASAEIENRLIRAIWHHEDLYTARYSTCVRQSLSQRGMALKTFWTHQWKNRAEAAERLAVTPERQLAGPSIFHGYTMSNNIGVITGDRDRNAVIRDLSCGTIEWSPPDGSHRDGMHTNFAPTTNYVTIPGTKPPVPVLPLDETGIILGPPDEYSNYHSSAPIDEQTFKLTVASLLGRFAWAHLSGKKSAQQLLQKQLLAMCQRLIEINKNDGIQVVAKQNFLDVPLPQLYMAWMGYVSLALNALYQRGPSNHAEDDFGGSAVVKFEMDFTDEADLNEEEEYEQDSDMGETSLVAIASRLFDTVHKGIESRGLERFGRLHLTFGLLRIAKDLPESAAEILSRPLDDGDRTPFEVINHLLEHMEENSQLVEDAKVAGSTTNFVRVGELEFSFHQAAKVFAKCIECDATGLDYHCWHLAVLAGSLLLCSGNRIGSGAHLYPSQLLDNDEQRLYDSFHGESKSLAMHEVRRMLPKFHELRRETAKALRLLFHLTKHQQSARAHLAISSFFEWRQAVALMLGPDSNEEIFAAFRAIHEYQVTQWALQDLTSRHFLQVREASIATGARLEALAVQLERNPHEKARWRALVEALGPIGTPNVTSGKKCEKTKCKACWILCPGLFVDHDNETQKQQNAGWWGRDRQCWWCHSILDFDTSRKITLPYHAKNLHESLAAELTPLTFVKRPTEQTTSSTPQPPIELYTSILEQPLNASASSTTASEEERCKTIDESLPLTFHEEISQERSEHSLSTTVPRLERFTVENGDDTDEVKVGNTADQASWDRLEVECYQILIACHLYSTDHEWVRWKVLDLAAKCWKGWRSKAGLQRDCDEMKGLKWLYQMGISGAHAVRISIRENRRGP